MTYNLPRIIYNHFKLPYSIQSVYIKKRIIGLLKTVVCDNLENLKAKKRSFTL
ncbi:hypothetical protein [Epilithonimonas zeae]|uniref:hypothetical protein n=1 Tax=Epilithonimonas zeae TaxID=1416779 RepID=UPI0020106B1C|nr:hypothetical protein [Epilithonimonas zeae]UQB70441.1 hypothetical protein KI430_08450 [Epilithonimonas zeae]